jgi:hypothetical protein
MEPIPPGTTTAELVRYAERTVGAALELELRDHLALAERVVNIGGDSRMADQNSTNRSRKFYFFRALELCFAPGYLDIYFSTNGNW